ncbi:hypothetical protein [Arthrobacter sp. SLBN-53]|nr:hypothetical protein [Arthrobacter sp. SLBN-53]
MRHRIEHCAARMAPLTAGFTALGVLAGRRWAAEDAASVDTLSR